MRLSRRHRQAGFTLVEISITMAVLTVVGGLAYSMLMSSTNLLAKNISLNSSNISVRSALDRINAEINQSCAFPTIDPAIPKPPCLLINADGTPASTSAPAAGVIFDRYLGGPYIVGNPGTGLPATATTFTLYYSLDPLVDPLIQPTNPPAPATNDVVMMDSSTRALVSSSTVSTTFSSPMPNPTPGSPLGRVATVTLPDTLGTYTVPTGTAVAWSSTSQRAAYVVHRKAFVVVPVSGVNGPPAELRMYPDAEKLTEIINDSTKYVVLTREIGTKTFTVGGVDFKEHLPFSLIAQNGATFLNIAMRVEDQQFNKRLATQQAKEFNTFLRVDTLLRPRNMP